jgi:flagellar hook assembly protein FlgD
MSYELPKAENVKIIVYNLFGQEVRILKSEYQGPGHHSVVWGGINNSGEKASSGVYYHKVTAGKYTVTKKMTLMK